MKQDNQKKFFIFIGPPGSGKGSLSHELVEKHDWVKLSTGNECRKHIAQDTEIGQQIDFALKSGKLVDDCVITDMVARWIDEQPEDAYIILDGYPRTVPQAQAFYQLLTDKFAGASLNVIRLEIADDAVINRLSGRLVCTNKECQAVYSVCGGKSLAPKNETTCDMCGSELERRSDDQPETIAQRLKTYYEHEGALLDFIKQQGVPIHSLNVEHELPVVLQEFKKLVGVK